MNTVTAYIALGSNVGDRAGHIAEALRRLEAIACHVVRVSSLLENPAIGMPPGSPSFLNAVAELATSLRPRPLLDRMLEIERSLGRVRSQSWTPRPIDLDLLLYGLERIDEPGLIVPHPRMWEREFVMTPLREIASETLLNQFL